MVALVRNRSLFPIVVLDTPRASMVLVLSFPTLVLVYAQIRLPLVVLNIMIGSVV